MNSETRNCQNCKAQFVIESEDFSFYKKMEVPPPTFCPECRLQRRLAWRNEKAFYRRACAQCGKSMISVYAPESKLNVFCSPCWWSDSWDGLEYGVDFDPSHPFLSQLHDLLYRVPVMNLYGGYLTLVNSDYTNMVGDLKNCYLVTHSDFNENCSYSSCLTNSKDTLDTLQCDQCELCYELVNCRKCYRTFFSLDSEDCRDVYFSKGCIGCSDCFGCVNLRSKQYYFFNEPYSKEEYQKKVADYLSQLEEKKESIWKEVRALWEKHPNKYMHERHNVDVTGDYIYNSKNTRDSFIVADMENSRFCALVTPGKTTDCYDFTHYGTTAELLYESLQVGNQVSRIRLSWFVISGSHDVEYSMFMIGSSNVLGCVGLKKREYCILNKQYSKEEYEKLRKAIIDQMQSTPYKDQRGNTYSYGEFFPMELSPFAYNETTAREFMPHTKEKALSKGLRWREFEEKKNTATVESKNLPSIKNVSDDILNQIISCEHEGSCNEQCTKVFKMIPQELDFYKRMSLPLPRLCSNCRHGRRLLQRNPMRLWKRFCNCAGKESSSTTYKNFAQHFHAENLCPNTFQTSYAPDRPEIVYCEQCYQAEVV